MSWWDKITGHRGLKKRLEAVELRVKNAEKQIQTLIMNDAELRNDILKLKDGHEKLILDIGHLLDEHAKRLAALEEQIRNGTVSAETEAALTATKVSFQALDDAIPERPAPPPPVEEPPAGNG